MHSKLTHYPTTHSLTLVYYSARLSTLGHSHLSAHWITITSAPREIAPPWVTTYMRVPGNISLSTHLPEGAGQYLTKHPTT